MIAYFRKFLLLFNKEARTTQQLLRIIIENGYYSPIRGSKKSSDRVCLSSITASLDGFITFKEAMHVNSRVWDFITSLDPDSNSLEEALAKNYYSSSFEFRKEILLSWERRYEIIEYYRKNPWNTKYLSTEMKPNTPQDVFDIIIGAGLYPTQHLNPVLETGMCDAIREARRLKLIDHRDFCISLEAIETYLGGSHSILSYDLEDRGLPNSKEDMLAIYKDWENRPNLKILKL